MPDKPLVHRCTSSWWKGTTTTLCGLTFKTSETRSPWFLNPKCPACEAVHEAKKKR